ncbi:putative RNA-directed DNA polymerase [Helianthus annuus]|nr:putative RNA-directed DNA polymerase [Helianthus annuus]
MGVLSSAKASVLINGSPTYEFQFQKGVRQGDPLSPFLFIIGMEALSSMLHKAKELNLFKGFNCPNSGPTLSHLFFADDALVIGEWSIENALNMARILRSFYVVSGLKINYAKSKLIGVGVGKEDVGRMALSIGCNSDTLPCTYLGLNIGANMNRLANWDPVIQAFDRRLSTWKASVLSVGGRLTLLKAVMETLPTYYFSLYKAPVAIINKLEARRRSFFWGSNGDKHKINWVKWDRVCMPKEAGGLGLTPLRDANIALLTKWWWRFKTQSNALWRKVVGSMHANNRAWPVLPSSKSQPGTWRSIANLENYMAHTNLNLNKLIMGKVGKGDNIRFWIDPWITSDPLKVSFPNLFLLENDKSCLVQDRYERQGDTGVWTWRWKRRRLNQLESNELDLLLVMLQQIHINQNPDRWLWLADNEVEFSVKSMKKLLSDANGLAAPFVIEWNNWVPLKANILVWKAEMDRLPTLTALRSRNVQVDSTLCKLCGHEEETSEHLFTSCIFASLIWQAVAAWCKVPHIYAFSVRDLLLVHKEQQMEQRLRKAFHGVMITACWCVWKARNEAVFSGLSPNVAKTLEDIKSLSYLWVKNRSSFKHMSWNNWYNFIV